MRQWFKNNFILGGVSFTVLILGFWLAIVHPKQQANEAYNSAVGLLRQETSEAERLQKDVERFSLWYKPRYLAHSVDLLKKVGGKIEQINTLAKKAESANVDEKYVFSNEALDSLQKGDESVSSLLSSVKQELDGHAKMTTEAVLKLRALQDKASSAENAYSLVKKRYIAEGAGYLSKYTKPVEEELAQANRHFLSVRADMERVYQFLPPDGDTNQSGEPRGALVALSVAEDALGQGYVFVNNVDRELSFQKEASEKVVQAVNDASHWSQKADVYLSVTAVNNKLSPEKSLRLAYSKYHDSLDSLKTAKETLQTKVEGKYDNPLAYKSALESIKNAKAAIVEADTQVRLMNEAVNGIRELEAAIKNVSPLLGAASLDFTALKQYHNGRVWQNVGDNAEKISSSIRKTEKALEKARSFADLNVERFSDAVDLVRSGIESMDQAQVLYNELHSFQTKLEQARRSWPGTIGGAQSKVDSERSEVLRYGSYSYSAKSDFEKAENLLRQARSAGKDRDYEEACSLAKSAKNYADGTGSKARQAYNDDQEEKERAAKRAREAQNRRSNSSSSSSSGSPHSYSGPRSHDGGGYSRSSSKSSDARGW
jgi:archaellum component FlaC